MLPSRKRLTSVICVELTYLKLFSILSLLQRWRKNAETAGENALLQLPYELGDK